MSFFDGVTNFFGGIGQSLLNLGNSAYNIFASERAHKEQQALNQQSVELANSQIQRGLDDAHKAGLSTAQYLGMNGMAGTPSLSTAGTEQVGAPDVQSPLLRKKEMERQEKLADLEVKTAESQMKKVEAETKAVEQDTEIKGNIADTDLVYKKTQIEKIVADIALTEAQKRQIEKNYNMDWRTWVYAIVGKLLGIDTGTELQNIAIGKAEGLVQEAVQNVENKVEQVKSETKELASNVGDAISGAIKDGRQGILDVFDKQTIGDWKLSRGIVLNALKPKVNEIYQGIPANLRGYITDVKMNDDDTMMSFYVKLPDGDTKIYRYGKKSDSDKISESLVDVILDIWS